MKLPRLINQGIDSAQAERDGEERQALLRHRQRLLMAHAYGRHTSVVEGCQECQFEIAVALLGQEPGLETPKGFSR